MATTITVRRLSALAKVPGEWLSESMGHGHGSLLFRALGDSSIAIYFRYKDGARRVTLPLGRYDADGASGLTLARARRRAGELSQIHAGGVTALKEHVDADARKKTEALRRPEAGTFGQMLEAYIGTLEEAQSVAPVRRALKRWVTDMHPHILSRRASEITRDDILSILTKPTEAGLGRMVNLLRSYLLASFNRALESQGDPDLMIRFGGGFQDLHNNPVALTRPVRKFERARDRVLSDNEFSEYLSAIKKLPFITSALMRLCILLGGQRPQQMLRVSPSDINTTERTVTILDGKGKRLTPRIHTLPIPDVAMGILSRLLNINGGGKYLFSGDGVKPLVVDTISHRVSEISSGQYQLRDIRRSIETRMASIRISREVRAQIQSHGLSGVQEKHYDKYTYLPEKLEALEAWNIYLSSFCDKTFFES